MGRKIPLFRRVTNLASNYLKKHPVFCQKPAVGRQESRFSLFFACMLTRYMSAGELAGGRT
jgi:hypothetical protein